MSVSQNDSASLEGGNHILGAVDYIDLMSKLHELNKKECEGSTIYKKLYHQCTPVWDNITCWPATPINTFAVMPCMAELNGIKYDSTQNATKWCRLNGSWDISNYTLCLESSDTSTDVGAATEVATALYFIGYSLSLTTLILAVFIFLYYKELRTLKNKIHTNLMFTHILANLVWILATLVQVSLETDATTCVILYTLLHYFYLTNFFWMFVEGLYLFLLVEKTFVADKVKIKVYLFIGWGIPIIVTLVWGIARTLDKNKKYYIHQDAKLSKHCTWMRRHAFDWFYQAPGILVLCVNVIFLIMIMWVLITKLRSTNNVETQQYWKATKALLVLLPLLGVTHMLFIAGPSEGQAAIIFKYVRAVLLSLQGFIVALFYCILNSDVQNTVKNHFSRWSTARSLGTDRRYYNNCSPHSRTDSIRLYPQSSNKYRKRESTVSETTTTTVIGPNSTTAFLDRNKEAICEDQNE